MKTLRAILIDPVTRTITEVRHEDDYKNIYKEIHCDTFTTVNLIAEGDAVFVDDDGRINGAGEKFGGFRLYGDPDKSVGYDLAGYGLVLGSDKEGDTSDALTTIEWLEDHITWLEPSWFAENEVPPTRVIPLGDDTSADNLLKLFGLDG